MTELIRNNFVSSKCTVCSCFVEEAYEHPRLKVIVCRLCFDAVNSSENKTNSCFWCGKDDDMLSCIQCWNKCCFKCINKNLGPDYVNILNEKNWSCFLCDSVPIKELRADYIRMVTNDTPISVIPEGAESTTDISSPIIFVDDIEEAAKRQNKRSYDDLDFILNLYDKQIRASLELEDANVPSIINEINSIETDQLNSAIYCYKKCLAAFASDLTNLEARVIEAESCNNPATIIKLTSLFKILIQHHTFNRFCHPQARLKDDTTALMNGRKSYIPIKQVIPLNSQVISTDPLKKKNLIINQQIFERKEKEVNEMVTKIKDLCSKHRLHEVSDEELSELPDNKRIKISEGENNVTPSWLMDLKSKKENIFVPELPEMITDMECNDTKIKKISHNGRKGKPTKLSAFYDKTFGLENFSVHDNKLKQLSNKPKREFINIKEPRYYVPKKNGEDLASTL